MSLRLDLQEAMDATWERSKEAYRWLNRDGKDSHRTTDSQAGRRERAATLAMLFAKIPPHARETMERLLAIQRQQGCNPITVSARELRKSLRLKRDHDGENRLLGLLMTLQDAKYDSELDGFDPGPNSFLVSGSFVGTVTVNGDNLRIDLSDFIIGLATQD